MFTRFGGTMATIKHYEDIEAWITALQLTVLIYN